VLTRKRGTIHVLQILWGRDEDGCQRERRKKREAERERGIAMDGYHISGSQEASSRA
jgi:hypothetical protein